MKALIIEDDRNKLQAVGGYIREYFDWVELDEAYSHHSGLKQLGLKEFDLVFLDMSLPTYDISEGETGFRFRQFAGREILAHLARREQKVSVWVVTQFPVFGEGSGRRSLAELDAELRRDFDSNYRGHVSYSASSEAWKSEIARAIQMARR